MGNLNSNGLWRHICMAQRLQLQVLLVITLSFLVSSPAQAQLVEPRPTVTRAVDLIADYSSPVYLGTEVVFTKKADLSENGRALIQAGVQVRVFSLDEDESEPKRITTIRDCGVYLSTVHRLSPTSSGGLRFAKMESGWVNLTNSRRSAKDGRWLLVFEQLGAPQEQFRIKTNDAHDYFEAGFIITVRDNGRIPLEEIQSEYDKRRDNLARLSREVSSSNSNIPCYSYKSIKASFEAGDVVAYGEIEDCAKSGSDVSIRPLTLVAQKGTQE
jgi:hypothetical protein